MNWALKEEQRGRSADEREDVIRTPAFMFVIKAEQDKTLALITFLPHTPQPFTSLLLNLAIFL